MVRLTAAAATLTCKCTLTASVQQVRTTDPPARAVLLPLALAIPRPLPLTPDPAGDKNIGNGQGRQFITGACLSDADCASGCCARLNGGGICSGPAVSFAQGKQGCGFNAAGGGGNGGSDTNNNNAAVPTPFPEPASPPPASGCGAAETVVVTPLPEPDTGSVAAPATGATGGGTGIDTSKPGAQNVGLGNGSQFITGQCFSDADCASGCCARLRGGGVCSSPLVAFESGKQGCGFVQGA